MKKFRIERVFRTCEELKGKIRKQNFNIKEWKIKDGFYLTPEEASNSKSEWKIFNTEKDVWSGSDKHYWFRCEFQVPVDMNEKDLWLSIGTQAKGWADVNPQFLLFVNGSVIQGVDGNHSEINAVKNVKSGTKIQLDLQAYTGSNNRFNPDIEDRLRLYSDFFEKDYQIENMYYNLFILNKSASYLKEDTIDRNKIEIALENAINMLDLRAIYSGEFYKSIESANEYLKDEIFDIDNFNQVIATCVGHTHIDVAWWWTVEQTKEKAVRSFTTALKNMDEYPDFKFMSSQPQLYKFVKQRYPEVYEKIKQRVKEGRWDPSGGMWLESDCNLTSGESLVRQFLHGKNFFKDEFGIEDDTLWLPDVFGYSAALPQIMEKSGIKHFMTTKIAWNEQNKLPYDTFWWKGINGSKVFTHLITTQEDTTPKDSFFTVYNGMLTPIAMIKAWDRYSQKELNNDVLVSFGYGDGGGGPTKEMIETGIRLKSGIPGVPKVRFETTKTYFKELYTKLNDNKKLPSWTGELYMEGHRGTLTSMGNNKRGNRICERTWQDVEFFSVFAYELGIEYEKEEIYNSWENILLNQFHDILPGTSIKEVYDVTKVEYDKLEKRGNKIIEEKIEKIAERIKANENDLILFNSLSFDRNDAIIIDKKEFENVKLFVDEYGNKINAEKTHEGKIIINTNNVKSKGYSIITPIDDETFEINNCVIMNGNNIETEHYNIILNESGSFISFYDKENDREILKPGTFGNELVIYEDMPILYDNWDINQYYEQKFYKVDNLVSSNLIENNSVRAILRNEYIFMESKIVQDVIFYSKSRRIDFVTNVDWHQHHLLLKTEFNIDINAIMATYDIQFGNIQRPTHKNTSWDAAKFEVCGHKWADLSEGNYGVSILNDCKYGHSIQNGKMTLSLIKCGIDPSPSDQGEHNFTYSILPHSGNFVDGEIQREAFKLNNPIYITTSKKYSNTIDFSNFLTIDSKNVIVETIKLAQNSDNIIIRVYENQNSRTKAKIKFHKSYLKIDECNLIEEKIEEIASNSNEIEFEIKPFEIKTFSLSVESLINK